MKEITDFLPKDAVAVLRIAEGDTKFPIRPIPVGDFLVGSGADCDLRLGDGLLPPLHSVIRVTATIASWTRLVREPEVFINGEAVRQATLYDGDLIELGPFRLQFRFVSAAAQPLDCPTESMTRSVQTLLQDDLHNGLPRLIDAIERDVRLIDAMDRSTADGLTELVAAARQLAQTPVIGTSAWHGESRTVSPPAEVFATTNSEDISRQLQLQTARMDSISDVLEHVIRQQRIMTEVLYGLTARVTELTQQQASHRRAG